MSINITLYGIFTIFVTFLLFGIHFEHFRKLSHRINLRIIKILLIIILSMLFCYQARTQSVIDSLEIRLKTVTGRERIKLLNELSEAYEEDFPEKCIEYGMHALKLSQVFNDRKNEARACINIGEGHENLSAYAKALEYYLKSLKIYEEINNKERIVFTLNNIGFIYYYLDDFDRALEYYYRALKISEAISYESGIAYCMNHIGLVYERRKEYDKALVYLFQSLEIFERIGEERRISGRLNNIGDVYNKKGKYKDALEYLQRSLTRHEEIGEKQSIAENLNNMGEAYINIQQYDKASECLHKAQKMAKEVKSNYLLCENYQHFSSLYNNNGNYKKSLEYYKLYSTMEDSLISAKQIEKIAHLQTMHLIENKENEIKLLNSEQKLKEAKLKSQRLWLIIIISGFTIILILSIIAYIQQVKKTNAYKVLVRKNLQIVEYEKKFLKYGKENRRSAKKDKSEISKKFDFFDSMKYSSSALTEEHKKNIMDNIVNFMEEEKLYLENDMTITKLSDRLNISRTYVSQVINEKFDKTFSNLINAYRIKEARKLLSEEANKIYTIDSISKSVGFNSTNAFNKAFKKFTGVTPSNYIKYQS